MMSQSPSSPPKFTEIVQIGIVVRDLEKSAAALSAVFGIGPFRMIVYPPDGRNDIVTTYRGQPGDFRYRQAFAEVGNLEIELIQPLSGRSIWADFLEKHGEGIHHIRFNVMEMESLLQHLGNHGIGVLQSGSGLRPGTFWANLDTEAKIGFTIEVMKMLPGTSGRTPQIVDGQVLET